MRTSLIHNFVTMLTMPYGNRLKTDMKESVPKTDSIQKLLTVFNIPGNIKIFIMGKSCSFSCSVHEYV